MSKLIAVRGPTYAELTPGHTGEGAEIVFVRQASDGAELPVYACLSEFGGWSQWGQGQGVLGDNVPAVTAWAAGMSEVVGMIDNDDDGEPDE